MKYILLILLLTFISSTPLLAKGPKGPQAKEGLLDLTEWNFAKQGTTQISGEWEFYWKRFIKPREFRRDEKPEMTGFSEYQRWKGTTVGETKLDEYGYATYRIKLRLKDPFMEYAIKIPEPLSSMSVYVNGMLLARNGKVGTTRETSEPFGSNTYLDFIPNTKDLEIILHISNYNYRDRGQTRTLEIGRKVDIYQKRLMHVAIDTFIIGSIIIMGLYHLGMYSIRRKKLSPLLFGLFCVFVGARTLATGKGDILHTVFEGAGFKAEKVLEFMGFFIGIACFTHLTHDLCEKESRRWQYIYYWPICIVFSLALVVLPTRFIPPLTKVFHPVALSAIISSFVVLGKGIKNKREGTILFLIGLISVAGSAINDILLARRVINTVPLSHFGLFFYIFIQAILIFKNFAKAFFQVEVSEKQIKKMNVELVEKEKARTLFFHNTSHELRTPLNGILGFVELLRRERYGKITPETKAQLLKVEDLANALKNQVNTILDIAKSKKGDLALTNSKICLGEIVDEARVLSEGLILGHDGLDIDIKTSWAEGEDPEYINDREKILTIIRNLLGNAFKFRDPKRPNNVVFEMIHSKDGIEIHVSDTGIGIPKDQQGKVFREFEQVETDTNRSYEGTGLGLSMVKSIVELMTGVITLSSEEGIGTTFIVKLPTQDEVHITQAAMNKQKEEDIKKLEEILPEGTLSEGSEPEEVESALEQSFQADKPYKILLVDDNEINLEVIGEVLKSNGYPIEKANGGQRALDMLYDA
jgi:signal transduction histidine kinase